jgi:hypothetical protein
MRNRYAKETSYHVFVIITQWTLIFNNFEKPQTKIDYKIHQISSDTNIKDYEATWHFKSLFRRGREKKNQTFQEYYHP